VTPEHPRLPHPSPSDLLDLHSGVARGARRARIAAHTANCEQCGETVAGLEWLQTTLVALPEEAPPADGLERVLDRVGGARPAPARRGEWVMPLAATLAGVAVGMGAIHEAGARLLALPFVAELPLLAPVRAASGYGLAALVFFGIGSFVTLALAPVLLIESEGKARSLGAR
jgi:hypothetical protein